MKFADEETRMIPSVTSEAVSAGNESGDFSVHGCLINSRQIPEMLSLVCFAEKP